MHNWKFSTVCCILIIACCFVAAYQATPSKPIAPRVFKDTDEINRHISHLREFYRTMNSNSRYRKRDSSPPGMAPRPSFLDLMRVLISKNYEN